MAAWPEVRKVVKKNRYELILSGSNISKRLQKKGLDVNLFSCVRLNFLQISDTCLDEIPPKINELHNLTSLVLHSNELKQLCPQIGELKKLKILDASNNQIEEIPEAVTELEALTTLNLSSNKIEKLPNMANLKWLSIVDLSQNKISDMSELCQKELVHLAELYLKGNKITCIPNTINLLSALKTVDFSDNEITEVPEEVGEISKLKEINLQGNPLTDKRFAKIVYQCKTKQILDYIREHCSRNSNSDGQKGKKGKKNRVKQNSCDGENVEADVPHKHKIIVTKADNVCRIKQTEFTQDIRPYILACIVKNVSFTVETLKKFIQLQTKMHDGICDKRNFATIATHDLASCKGRNFTYTALPPENLKIVPLSRSKEVSGKELYQQLQTEADNYRKEKKRSTYSGIHKFLHLLEDKPLYPCLLNEENSVISFPPLTNSEMSKISVQTKEILIEVTSSSAQGNCKKVLDCLLREMVLGGLAVTADDGDDDDASSLTVEQVKIEEPNGNLIAVYPSRIDLQFEGGVIDVIRL